MEKIVLNENELGKRWGISPKTLQRWRSEGRGPKYLKLSKRVTYRMAEILAFEAESMYSATWEKGSDVITPNDSNLMSASEIAYTTSIPMYVLTQPRVREALGLPFMHVGKSVRFKLDEVMTWARKSTAEMKAHGIEMPSPQEQRRTLLTALANLPA